MFNVSSTSKFQISYSINLSPSPLRLRSTITQPENFTAPLEGTVQFVIPCRISIKGLTPSAASGESSKAIFRHGEGEAREGCRQSV